MESLSPLFWNLKQAGYIFTIQNRFFWCRTWCLMKELKRNTFSFCLEPGETLIFLLGLVCRKETEPWWLWKSMLELQEGSNDDPESIAVVLNHHCFTNQLSRIKFGLSASILSYLRAQEPVLILWVGSLSSYPVPYISHWFKVLIIISTTSSRTQSQTFSSGSVLISLNNNLRVLVSTFSLIRLWSVQNRICPSRKRVQIPKNQLCSPLPVI